MSGSPAPYSALLSLWYARACMTRDKATMYTAKAMIPAPIVASERKTRPTNTTSIEPAANRLTNNIVRPPKWNFYKQCGGLLSFWLKWWRLGRLLKTVFLQPLYKQLAPNARHRFPRVFGRAFQIIKCLLGQQHCNSLHFGSHAKNCNKCMTFCPIFN